jgi:hypothetical protein
VLEAGNLIVGGSNVGINTNNNAASLTMERNVVALNADANYQVGPKQTGAGNVFRDNCVWMADVTSGINGGAGVTLSENVTADPMLDADWSTGVVKATNPICAAKLPVDSRFRP